MRHDTITSLLQSSISREQNKRKKAEQSREQQMAKRIVELESEVRWLRTRNATLRIFAGQFCDEMEGIFRSTGQLASPEIAMNYLVCARFLDKHFERKEHLVDDVNEWLEQQ